MKQLLLKFKKYLWLPILLIILVPQIALAQDKANSGGIGGAFEAIFQRVIDVLNLFLYFKIGGENGMPLIVLWLILGGIFFYPANEIY